MSKTVPSPHEAEKRAEALADMFAAHNRLRRLEPSNEDSPMFVLWLRAEDASRRLIERVLDGLAPVPAEALVSGPQEVVDALNSGAEFESVEADGRELRMHIGDTVHTFVCKRTEWPG